MGMKWVKIAPPGSTARKNGSKKAEGKEGREGRCFHQQIMDLLVILK